MLKRTTSWPLLLVIAFFTMGVGVRLFALWQQWPSHWLNYLLSLLVAVGWLACVLTYVWGSKSFDLFLFAAFLFTFLSMTLGWVTGAPKQNPLWYNVIGTFLLGILTWATFPASRIRLARRRWRRRKTLQITP